MPRVKDNVTAEVRGHKLHLVIDLKANLGRSASGRSIIVASTHGPMPILGTDGVRIILTAFRAPLRNRMPKTTAKRKPSKWGNGRVKASNTG